MVVDVVVVTPLFVPGFVVIVLPGSVVLVVTLVVVVVVVVVGVGVVVVVVDGTSGGIGGCLYMLSALAIEGCLIPGKPDPNASRTFSVIFTTGAMGQLPMKEGHGDPRAATQRLVPVANTPAPLAVV